MKGLFKLVIILFFAAPITLSAHINKGFTDKSDDKEIATSHLRKLLSIRQQGDNDQFDEFEQDFDALTHKLNQKRSNFKTEQGFLKFVFYNCHKKYLKNYTRNSSLYQLFDNGNYDCLSGTAFYALVLEKLGFQYDIIETNYHILLEVKLENERLIIESTDPKQGFVHGEDNVQQRIADIEQENIPEKAYYSEKVFNVIGLRELVGLFYYNIAVENYNAGNYWPAVSHMDMALTYHPTKRLYAFQHLVKERLGIKNNTVAKR